MRHESLIRRREGHIEMSTNHRTLPQVDEYNERDFQRYIFTKAPLTPGPWHAESQDLVLPEILKG